MTPFESDSFLYLVKFFNVIFQKMVNIILMVFRLISIRISIEHQLIYWCHGDTVTFHNMSHIICDKVRENFYI